MSSPLTHAFNPELDLKIERTVDVAPELVWKAWTQPEHIVKWFTPDPWKTTSCEIDLRPGGRFNTVMQSPEGKEVKPTDEGLLKWSFDLKPAEKRELTVKFTVEYANDVNVAGLE